MFKENISITNNENLIKIQIKLNKDILAMIDETELKKQLFDYLNEKFIADFDINIIQNEIKTLKLSLKARNIKFNLKTFFTKSHIIFILFFANIFKRVNVIEKSLILRGLKLK